MEDLGDVLPSEISQLDTVFATDDRSMFYDKTLESDSSKDSAGTPTSNASCKMLTEKEREYYQSVELKWFKLVGQIKYNANK